MTVTLIGSPTRPVVPVDGFVRNVMQTCAGDETDPLPLRNSLLSACCWIQFARLPPGWGELPITAAWRTPSLARWFASSQ